MNGVRIKRGFERLDERLLLSTVSISGEAIVFEGDDTHSSITISYRQDHLGKTELWLFGYDGSKYRHFGGFDLAKHKLTTVIFHGNGGTDNFSNQTDKVYVYDSFFSVSTKSSISSFLY